MNNTDTFDHEIAIIGMAGRFPGARNIDEFWQNLRAGVESITFFSDEEALAAGIDPRLVNNPTYIKAYSAIEDIELFDAAFFGYSPREAQTQDPQHRLFLECAWEALENAGYDTETYKGRVGVYAGASMSSYLRLLSTNPGFIASMGDNQILIGNDKDYVPTRVSYKLNLKGPSIAVQTACSTSLVAVHLACQSLLNGESDISLAGGVSIGIPQKAGYFYQEGMPRSPDGHCRAFDARAQGMISGNGVAIVVLKRLTDALADGDCIHAVIKGSAINNDGSLKIGYTAPSIDGQAEVITEALAVAEVEPETITYIETHGTGTPLGDPIEVAALTQAFHTRTQKNGFCAIGSVKTNIGHLDAAAGIAGLIKTVLALKYHLLPPSLNFEEPNPEIDFANSPFYVNTRATAWETGNHPRRAGVSSFGLGGTNAHIVLEEAPVVKPPERAHTWQLLVLSAKTSSALETATSNLVEHLKGHPDLHLTDVAHTYQSGRRAFNHRRIVVCQHLDDAITLLEKRHPQRVFSSIQESRDIPIMFMFPGGGAQHVNMGLELYQHEPVFRAQVDRCSELLKPHLGFDLRTVLYPSSERAATEQLREPAVSLAALFATEYALAKLWMSWGVHPQAMIGHSLGEYVAACLAGVFSLQDALALVAFRGRLFEELPEGMMLSVPLPAQELSPLLTPTLSLAAVNAPSLCVVSGPVDAIVEMETKLIDKGIEVRRIPIKGAGHSQMVVAILEKFTRFVARIRLQAPSLPYISNVTGTWITAQEATSSSYWATHLRQTVRFADGVQTLLQKPTGILLEVGPGHTLSMLARQQIDNTQKYPVCPSFGFARDPQSEMAALLTTAGQLWLSGVGLFWPGVSAHEQGRRLPLPTYPFERQRYWIESEKKATSVPQIEAVKKSDQAKRFYLSSWKQSVLPELQGWEKQVEQKGSWLVFANESVLGTQITKRLQARAQQVITVVAGARFSKSSDGVYTINPRAYDNYAALIADLGADRLPGKVLSLWGVTQDEQASAASAPPTIAGYQGFSSLLFLIQALSKQQQSQHLDIMVVSNSVQDVTGEETLHPQKAALLGPCKVIPQEYPHITCRAIDIGLPKPGTRQEEKLIDYLIAESAAQTSDQAIAYRGNHRWVQTFEEVSLHAAMTGNLRPRDNGVYLFIDKPADSGIVLTEYLASAPQARLTVVEPPDFPPRDTWERWLATHDERNTVNCKILQLQALEEARTEMLVIYADSDNLEHMQSVIDQTYTRFGELHGVISMAGLVEDALHSPIQEMAPAACELYLQAKMEGLDVLEQVLQNQKLDFCLVCSSLSSVFGRKERVVEAATGFLIDTLASRHNQATATSWLSAHWDTRQPDVAQEQHHEGQTPLALTPEPITEGYSSHPRPDLQTAYEAPRNQIEQTIAVLWQELLGIDQIGIYDNFFGLGGHSLMAARLIARLRDVFLMEIPLKSLFEKPTIGELAEGIEELFVEKLEQLSEEEAERLMSNMFQRD